MTVLFVSGTGTGVGKTVVTAAIAALAKADGKRVALVKPAQTGLTAGEEGDMEVAARLSGVRDARELARYPDPLAPATAARRLGLPGMSPFMVSDTVAELARTRDLVLVEGVGGVLVHLGKHKSTVAEIAGWMEADVVIVTRPGLGALNEVALTVEALRSREAVCAGVVIGSWPSQPDLASWCNVNDFEDYAEAPLLGAVPENVARLDRKDFFEVAQRSLAPELGGNWDAAAFRAAAHAAAG